MAHYVDTHPDFTDCFVLRSATTGEWQYVGDEDYVIEMVDGWGDVVTEAIGYTTRELAEQAAAKEALALMGYDTGVDLVRLVAAAQQLPAFIGHDIPSQIAKAGPRLTLHPVPADFDAIRERALSR